MTQWRKIPGFSRYQISDEGAVRTTTGRPVKPYDVKHRRQVTLVRDEGKQTSRNVGALVLQAFVGPAPAGTECSHRNGDYRDNRLENLAWETHQENVDRQREHGTRASAERHQSAKLTDAQVLDILDRLATGERAVDLAREYGVAQNTITGYKQGRRHVARVGGRR